MLKLAFSMRVMVSKHGEFHDALSCEWLKFIKLALPNFVYIPIPNIGSEVVSFIEKLDINGLVLTGGENWGVFSKRDETEESLFTWARGRVPILGICRGAQIINRFCGGENSEVCAVNHVATRHMIKMGYNTVEVNSFHNFGILPNNLGKNCEIIAKAEDESIEAFLFEKNCMAIMWHPEREKEPAKHDMNIFRQLFCNG